MSGPGATARPLRALADVRESRAEGRSSYRLVLEVAGWPGFAPGQFVMISPGTVAGAERLDPLLPRPMAVYRAESGADAARVDVLYKVTGRGTALLAEARPGERVRVVGPLGRPFPEPEPGEAAVLVGGGTGIASLYELAARARARAREAGGGVCVLLGARTAGDLLGRVDFERLGVDVRIATEDGSAGARGLVTGLLEDALSALPPSSAGVRLYACGPHAMMRAAAALAAARGLTCTVSLENPMACGFGVCLGCAAPLAGGGVALVCRDGPVFDAARIDWDGWP